MADFIETRSFLISNSENLLENISIRRQVGKNEAEDLFGGGEGVENKMNWNTNFIPRSKIEILLQEKESLGLYVSGHPLDDYKDLLVWCREVSGRDDIFLILIDKIKKIFTKANTMMFVLQISVPDLEAEGIIFPKNALSLSPLLEEKELYWVKGKVQQSKKSAAQKSTKKPDAENGDEIEVEKAEGEIKEFDELPKLIIEELKPFEEGVPPLFDHEDIPMAVNRMAKLKKVSWKRLKTHPTEIPDEQNHNSQTTNTNQSSQIPVIFLSKALGPQKLKQIKTELKNTVFSGCVEVKVDVDSAEGVKRVKGTFYTSREVVDLYKAN